MNMDQEFLQRASLKTNIRFWNDTSSLALGLCFDMVTWSWACFMDT